MSSLEFKRIAFSSDIKFETGVTTVDGNMVKRLASGGNPVEVRTNYKDETRKKLQSTLFLYCNDFPPVVPDDAYGTLEVFSFKTTFVEQSKIGRRGEACPKEWKPKDDKIKEWIRQPEVIDAFTMMILESYHSTRLSMPAIVQDDTFLFKGPAAEKPIDRISEIVMYEDDSDSIYFIDEIKIALNEEGFSQFSSHQIKTYVLQLYGRLPVPPVFKQYTKQGKRSYGFNRISLHNVVAYDARKEMRNKRLAERLDMCNEVRKKSSPSAN